jgi:hypothetical protein
MSSNRIIEAMDFESNTSNWKYSFKTMCSKYGKDFFETIKAMWEANGGGQTEEEFIIMNNIPKDFFEKHIKK